MRARVAGFRGVYVPAMQVHHHVPSARLTRRYFRRWWFWKGVSRAALERAWVPEQGAPSILGA